MIVAVVTQQFLLLTRPQHFSQHPLGEKCQVNLFCRTLQRPLAQFNPIPFHHRLIWNPILVSQRLLHLDILLTLPCFRNRFLLIQTIVQSTRTHHFLPNQQFSDPSASTTLGSAPYQNPISMSTCFQKSVPKLPATKFVGNPLDCIKWFSIFLPTIDRSPMSLSEKMIHLQSLLTGEAKHSMDGYGCNGSLYVPALNRLEKHFGNPNRLVNAFLDKLSQFKPPNLTFPESCTQFSAFFLTIVVTFQQLGFNHDIHSTTKLNQALNKLPTPVHLHWNKYVLDTFSLQPSSKDLSEWLSIYAKACTDFPTPISVTRTRHGRSNFAHKPWTQKTQSPFPSSTRTTSNGQHCGSFFDGNKQGPSRTVVCPSNENWQYLHKCSHLQSLAPFDRREHVKNLKH